MKRPQLEKEIKKKQNNYKTKLEKITIKETNKKER